MDGFGSGHFGGAKRCVEECITLTTSWMLHNKYFDLELGGKRFNWTIAWTNYFNGRPYTLTFDLERTSLIGMRFTRRYIEQVVFLVATEMRFGGVRWWFKCPRCFRRCANLHFEHVSEKFFCRVCLDLTYRSCQQSHSFDSLHAEIASGMGGITGREVGRMVSRAKRGHKSRWVRKRDRRSNYRARRICPMYPLCAHD